MPLIFYRPCLTFKPITSTQVILSPHCRSLQQSFLQHWSCPRPAVHHFWQKPCLSGGAPWGTWFKVKVIYRLYNAITMFSTFTVSFLGAFTPSLGVFYYCWALWWYFHGTPSQPLSVSHSWRAAVSSRTIISKVKLGLFSFRHSILHLSTLLSIFTLQHNQSPEAPLRPALPCESAENLSGCRGQCLTGLLSLG